MILIPHFGPSLDKIVILIRDFVLYDLSLFQSHHHIREILKVIDEIEQDVVEEDLDEAIQDDSE